MNNCKHPLFLSLLAFASLTVAPQLSAQEEPAQTQPTINPDAETPELPEGAISQGEFAVKFASKMGLWKGMTRPLTPTKAISLLTEIGISPFGGWNAANAVTPNDFARMLVQHLKALDEIDDAEEDNPETTAYMDYLKRKYNLDVNGVDVADTPVIRKGSTTPSSQFNDSTSTNPLEGRGSDGEIDELRAAGLSSGAGAFNFVSDAEVDRVLLATVPSQGNDGRVDGSSNNTTPSAPTP